MQRRTLIAVATALPLAGCSEFLDDDGTLIDATLTDEEPHEFGATTGDEIEVTVSVRDVASPDDEDDDDGDALTSVSFRISHEGGSPVALAESIEEGTEETFQLAIEESATYVVAITNGTADVLIERL